LKIVILDGYTLNPGDLSWERIDELGELVVYDRTPAGSVVERAHNAEIVFTNKTPLTADVFRSLPKLKYVGVLATGYNVEDIEAASECNVCVTNIPTYGTQSVAQMTFALLLELCLNVQKHSDAVHAGEWARNSDFCFWKYPLIELASKTMGIVGFGRIGQKVADIAEVFGMKVIAYDKVIFDQPSRKGFRWAELDELLKESDVVSLHCPLFPDTKGIINKNSLRLMKKTAFLINTSRGPLIAEEDLADALNSGAMAGAALDVLSVEPPTADNPLLHAKNCIVTPHISWATREARARLMDIAVDNLTSFLEGKPVNRVNR
jgi:glycerate dehydrogenase